MNISKILFTYILFCLFSVSSIVGQRYNIEFSKQWKFSLTQDAKAAELKYDDSNWSNIDIPHTWNALDGQDGGKNYARTIGWYRKKFEWRPEFEGKRIYLEVLAASLMSDTYINGKYVGQHKGGYNAFRYDITDFLNKSTTNVLAIKVDNSYKDDIAPLSADFTFFGGIYRNVNLVVADNVHVDLADNGSNGLYLTTTDVSQSSAKLNIKAIVKNNSNATKRVRIKALIKTPETFNGVSGIMKPVFDTLTMVSGTVHKTVCVKKITIAPNSDYVYSKDVILKNPRLWDGLRDPFRYQVDLIIEENNTVIDKVTDYVGFRYFHVDSTGFYLNGRLYPLRGVNRHQDWKDLGPAITKNEENIDFSLIYNMGANACRLAHYPQSPYFHELFDKYGIVVWVEIPFVDKVGNDTTAFMTTTRQQLREMILQRYNRPSILMWGLQNEVNPNRFDALMSNIMPGLNNYAKSLDSTRLTVQAQFLKWTHHWTTDIYANNIYHGWYGGGRLRSTLDSYRRAKFKGEFIPMGISEYGAGGNANQHEVLELSGTTSLKSPYGHNNPWHPEEYQTKVHELAIKDINARPWIWGTFLWAMFDFSSDGRNEGSTPGINDKGIVSHDRRILKDSYYLYKANWSKTPVVHIGSRRFTERFSATTPVSIYTNSKQVELIVNGVSQGIKSLSVDSACVLHWREVGLTNVGVGEAGQNEVIAKCIDTNVADTVVWYRRFSNDIFLKSDRFTINNQNRLIALNNAVTIEDFVNSVFEIHGGSFVVLDKDGVTVLSTGLVSSGMKLKVTAEDKTTQIIYDFVIQHLAFMKPVSSSSNENQANSAQKIVDGDLLTRWAAAATATPDNSQWFEIDLGKEYMLNNIGIHWFNNPSNSRAYKYQILAKKKSTDNYELILDKVNNVTMDFTNALINNVIARYIRINVMGSTNTTQSVLPSVYELVVNGWAINSTVYNIDYTSKTISVPFVNGLLQHADFLRNIQIEGNFSYSVDAGAYHILNGDKLIITDSNGRKSEFTVLIRSVSSAD